MPRAARRSESGMNAILENWSGRWESNPHGRRLRGLKCDGRVNFRGMWDNVGMRWSLFGRDFASRPVDAPCRPPYAAAWRSTSQPLHASRTVRGTSCSPLT
jgi:hypothetical protein